MTHQHRSLDLTALRRRYEAQTGILTGFTTAADRLHLSHIVRLVGLCREHLGDVRFRFVLHSCTATAVSLAPSVWTPSATVIIDASAPSSGSRTV